MTEKLLVVAPRFDTATEYSFDWAGDFLKIIEDNPNVEYSALLKDMATKRNFDQFMPLHDILIFFDHGIKDALIGQGLEKLVTNVTAGKFAGKKVFTMACLSALELGKYAYHSGCLEYWGATESIGFTLVDADLFGEVFVQGAYERFVLGLPIEEVMENMQNHFVEQMDKTTNPWTKVWLQKDKDMWVCWHEGNKPETPKAISLIQKIINAILNFLGINFATEKDCKFDVLS